MKIVWFESNSNINIIESFVFENYVAYQEIKILPSVKLIGWCVFKNFRSEKKITVDPSIQEIQHCAFEGYESLNFRSIQSFKQIEKISFPIDPMKMNVIIFGCSSVGQKSIFRKYCYNEFTEMDLDFMLQHW